MKLILFACVIFLGLTSSVVLHGMFNYGKSRRNVMGEISSVVASLLVISLVLWGFASFAWYWTPLAFIAGLIIARVALTNISGLHPWISKSPLIDIVVAIGAIFLWAFYWPY